MAEMSPLRRRMIEDMTVRNLSPATQRSYIHAVAKFSRHFRRSPDQLGLEEVRAFQVALVAAGISWPALNQTVCALRFFYGVTLGQAELPERIPYAREPRRLPVVLSADEVVRFLEAVPGLKSRTALTTAYAAGLRASEAVRLDVSTPERVGDNGGAAASAASQREAERRCAKETSHAASPSNARSMSAPSQ
jgi:integrase/recombinase XerD